MLTIKAENAPDDTYGPFNLNCALVVKDGVVTIEPIHPAQGEGDYHLVVNEGYASLEFRHAAKPAPEPDLFTDEPGNK